MPASDVYQWAKEAAKPTYNKNEIGLDNVDNTSDASKPISTAAQAALNGKANLVNGKVPANELPSYVDDVLEGTLYSVDEFRDIQNNPYTPESGKIYLDVAENKQYRWSGSVYVSMSDGLALGETANTAFAGNRGKALETTVASLQESKVDKVEGKGLSANDYTTEEKNKLSAIGVTHLSLTLIAANWDNDVTGGFWRYYIFNTINIVDSTILIITPSIETFDIAIAANMYPPTINTGTNTLTLNAKNQPTGNIVISVSVINYVEL